MSLVTYSSSGGPFGPWTNGSPPGISAAALTAIEAFLSAGWFDSSITSNGSGVMTLLGLIANGTVTLNGSIRLQSPGSAQSLSNGNTITLTEPIIWATTSGNVTGIIMTAGTTAGQLVLLYNKSSAGSITFAASSSNVRQGSNVSIAIGRSCWLLWDGSAWSPTAGA